MELWQKRQQADPEANAGDGTEGGGAQQAGGGMDRQQFLYVQQAIDRLEKVVNTTHTMARVTLSLKGLEELMTLQLQNGLDMGVNYYSSRSAKEFLQLKKEEELSRIKEEIKEANFLCLIADGSNDKGSWSKRWCI